MTKDEALKMALEALEEINQLSVGENAICLPAEIDGAMDAIREALAQPEMQPCAGRNCGSTNPNLHSAECFEGYEKSTGMSKWQGLTNEEIIAVAKQTDSAEPGRDGYILPVTFARAIEAAHEFVRGVEAAHGIKENT